MKNVEVKKVFGTVFAIMVSVVTFFMVAYVIDEGVNLLTQYSKAVWAWWYLTDVSTLEVYIAALTPAFLVYGKLIKACEKNL